MSGIDRFSRGRKKTTNNSQPPAADPSPVMGSTTTAGGGFGGGDDFGFMGGSFGGFGFDTQQEQGFGGFSGGGDAPTNESFTAPIVESTEAPGIGLFKTKGKKKNGPPATGTSSLFAPKEPAVPTPAAAEDNHKWTPQMEKRDFIMDSFDGNDISGPSSVEVPAGGSNLHLLFGKSASRGQNSEKRKSLFDSRSSDETQHLSAKTPGPKPSSRHSKTPGPSSISHHSKTPGPNQATMLAKTPNTSTTAPSESEGTWVSPVPEDSSGKLPPPQNSDDDAHSPFVEGTVQNLRANDTTKKLQGVSTPGVSSNITPIITPNNDTNTGSVSSFNGMMEGGESLFGKEIATNTAKQQDAPSTHSFDLNPPEDDRILPLGTNRASGVTGPVDAMGPPPPRKKDPRVKFSKGMLFQNTHEEFETFLRDADDKHKSFEDTLLDATVELDIATAELLECQAGNLDFTMELDDLKMALMENIQKLRDESGNYVDEEELAVQ